MHITQITLRSLRYTGTWRRSRRTVVCFVLGGIGPGSLSDFVWLRSKARMWVGGRLPTRTRQRAELSGRGGFGKGSMGHGWRARAGYLLDGEPMGWGQGAMAIMAV
ncbi:hypothetical protein VTH06DRAFT_5098 [Thermothelomyces fergusii]